MVIMPFVLYYILMILTIGRQFGLNTGIPFYTWVKSLLETNLISVKTTGKLYKQLDTNSFNDKPDNEHARMVLISSNLTHNRIVKFPERADLYWRDPDQVTPAAYLRATMSIPFVYETFIPDESHTQGSTVGSVILRARFVDGGMLSNFPIREFHTANTPRFPTFGVLLSENPVLKTVTLQISPPAASRMDAISLFSYIVSFISTFRNFYDNDYLTSNEEIRLRVEAVDTKKFNALNFWMIKTDKEKLFKAGAEAAIRQLEKFEWNQYVKLR
jgi:NTE family protein